jgi:hypothetical protein
MTPVLFTFTAHCAGWNYIAAMAQEWCIAVIALVDLVHDATTLYIRSQLRIPTIISILHVQLGTTFSHN